jgi:glucan endo-1,6-beta-glucosidase
MVFLLLVIQAFVLTTLAWLPGEHKHIYSRDGLNLFNRSNLYENGRLAKRYLPTDYDNDKGKIRGVNLGSLFVLENWLADNIMAGWGCNSTSEFDCVSSLHNQTQANIDFQGHWQTWVTASDFTQMVSYGLNTVRIPVGYWIYNELIDSSEHFPWGGEAYLDQVVGYAKSAGLYVIIDLHGAPGAQTTNADTGQCELGSLQRVCPRAWD